VTTSWAKYDRLENLGAKTMGLAGDFIELADEIVPGHRQELMEAAIVFNDKITAARRAARQIVIAERGAR
jgi:hypothetical protein